MSLRSFARASLCALTLGLGAASAALSGCGREELPVDELGGGGSGGSPSVGGGGEGGAGGSTCTPIDELCNTVDDDCDGQVDEGCACTDGQTQPCYSGPPETVGIGPCKQGAQQCKGGAWGPCSGDTLPIPEQCDAVDNDCDGQTDEGNPGGGTDCILGLAGVCGAGLTKCNGGQFLCSQAVFPSPEVCDGLDNNCNGLTDEDNPGGGAACSTGLFGTCEAGATSCSGGAFECLPVQPPTMEVCDGLDNDCDGVTDDGNPGSGAACNTGLPGACSAGTTTCSGGALTCKAASGSIEVCDGLDNDCDGTVDDVPGLGNPCFTGDPPPCNQGTFLCQGGALQCLPVQNNQAETCDNLDNDCDGQIDEGNPGGGATCNTGIPGVCGPGTLQCQSGMLGCIANASQGAELCAGTSDEDCDGASATVFFTETFANDTAGWTLDQEWQIGSATASPPMGIYGNPDPAMDHTPSADNGVAGVVIGGNAQQNPPHGFRWLTSPTIPVDPAATTVYLQFWRWLNSDFSPWMTNRVEIFNATTNQWEQVWQSGGSPGVIDNAWTKQVYDITNKSKGGSIQVRFGFNIGANGAFLVSQWNVDDVVVTTEPCE